MADESKEYVLKFEGDVTALLKSINTAEEATQRMQATLGSQAKGVSQIIEKSASSFKQGFNVDPITKQLGSLGNEVGTVSTRLKLADGTIGTYTEGMKRMSDGTVQATGSFRESSSATESYGASIGRLLKRALLTIPIWMALRIAIQGSTAIFKSSIKFLIDWEYQLAQIAIVGNATKQTLIPLSGALLELGKSFGISIKDLGEASKLWAQQGRAISEIIPLMRTTAQLSLLTGQSTVKAVEDLTAITKAYGISAENTITIVDSMTNVMLKHAITVEDLASAYKQVASTASSLGVSFDSLTGYITAIKAVTRDSGSKIGLSLRTMFSRITTSSAPAIQNLASVPLYMDLAGKATFAVTPRMRNLTDIISELALKFNTLGSAQQSQLASLVGGVRRQNQVFALFNNFTEAVQAQTDSIFGLGRASGAITVLTDTAKLGIEKLKNTWFSFVDSIGSSQVIANVLNGIASAVEGLDKALNPDKFNFKSTLNNLNKQNDGYARQLQYLNGINTLLTEAQQLEGQSLRANDKQKQTLNDQADIYRKSFNEASKVAGLDFKVSNTGGLKGLSDEFKTIATQANTLKIDTLVNQQLVNIKSESISTGQELAKMVEQFNKFTVRTGTTRFEFEEKGLGDIRRNSKELFNTIVNLSKITKEGLEIPNSAFDKFVELTKTYGNFSDAEQVLLSRLIGEYQTKNELLANEGTVRESVIKQLETEVAVERDITLEYAKRDIISKLVLEDQLEKLKMAGALNSEALVAEGLLKKQLGIEEAISDRIQRQLAIQREKTKEQRLQSKLGSDSMKLFEIAQQSGTGVAKQIGDVLSGDVDFSGFIRRGGEAVDIFKKEFADIFQQQQAISFFKGNTVPGLEGLRGGRGVNIQEEGIRKNAQTFNVQAELQKQRLLQQEQNAIMGTQSIQNQVQVDAPINVNVDVGSIDEIGDAVVNKISQQLPQAGTKINKALTSALYNKQTNSL